MSDSIHKKMAAILAEFPAVTKDRLQPQAKYNYRGIDDALRELNPLLSKHGVYLQLVDLVPTFMDAGTTKSGNTQVRCVVVGKVRFVSHDGSYTEASLVGEGVDTGDKAMMKAQANGLKYVLWYTFCVPTDEKKDSEAFEDPDTGPAPARTRRSPKKNPDGGAPPDTNGGGDLSGAAQDIFQLISGCKKAEDLLGIRKQVRMFVEPLKATDPVRKKIVDEFVAKQSELGA